MEMQNGAATMENSLNTLNIELPYSSASPLVGIHLKIKNKCSNKNLYVNFHISTSHSSQKVKTTQTCINRWINKQMWHIHIREYYSTIRNEVLIHETTQMNLFSFFYYSVNFVKFIAIQKSPQPNYTNESWRYYVKKLDIKDYILYDSVYLKYPEEPNPLRQKTDFGCRG